MQYAVQRGRDHHCGVHACHTATVRAARHAFHPFAALAGDDGAVPYLGAEPGSYVPQIVSPLDPSDVSDEASAGSIADVARVRGLLVAAAGRGEAMSYSGLLDLLGHRFTRPKMRALCRTLDAIDEAGARMGEPDLAVLVVRESDRLPGQGWWTAGPPLREGYEGQWTGPQAAALVRELQKRAFAYWAPTPARRTSAKRPKDPADVAVVRAPS